jgi:hypothetical protein
MLFVAMAVAVCGVLAAWLVVHMLMAGNIVEHKTFGGDGPQSAAGKGCS